MSAPEETEAVPTLVDKLSASITDYVVAKGLDKRYEAGKTYTIDKYDVSKKYVVETYDASKTYANEKAVEPVVAYVEPKYLATKDYTLETYDVTSAKVAELVEKVLKALGSRPDKPEEAVAAEPAAAAV
mmetsp:Transcript_17237/g.53012  ORF Transcript_17237/g.53012 Transcript_17237/m.53012 type:complete len:129 (-) Transcript_17237:57-443(-)